MKYTRQQLIQRQNNGVQLNFLHFWGHQPSKDGSTTKSCFSQWWLADFKDENGFVYKTAEHFMMAGKAKLFNDEIIFQKIIETKNPKEVKALGRLIKDFNPQLWNENKFEIVKKGNLFKFSQNENLKSFLLNTDNQIIVEASPLDFIWGIGLDENNPNANIVAKWQGENLLGFALMEVRDELKKFA